MVALDHWLRGIFWPQSVYGGTGLGLALVWCFCQPMGGEVNAEGTPAGGARFTVCLRST